MAGSKKWFNYTTDRDDVFAIFLDESNTEAANGTGGDYTSSDTEVYAVPRNVRPREAYYGNTLRTLRVTILTRATFDALTPASTITDPFEDGGTLNFIRARAERISFPRGDDTGQDDGDET